MTAPTPLACLLRPLFSAFDQENVRHCVLRGHAKLPAETRNDVDLAVDPAAMERAEAIVRRVVRETGWLLVGRVAQDDFLRLNVFHPEHPGGVLPLDLCSEHTIWGMTYADAETVLATSREHAGLRVAAPGCEAAVSLLKGLLRHGVVKKRPDHRERLEQCVREDADGFRACTRDLLGEPLCESLLDACGRGAWDEVEALARPLRARLMGRAGRLRVATRAVRSALRTRWLARTRRGGLEFRGGLFICLLGPDGSGKTTLSLAIEERIGGLFAETEQFHSLAGVLPRLGILKKAYYAARGKKVPDSPLKGLAQPGVVAKPMPTLRTTTYILYYGLEYVLYRFTVARKLRRNHLVIFDRYFYDYYLMRIHLNAPRWLLDLFSRWIAQPDVLFVMLADPEAIFRRKPELTPEEIQRQQDILKGLRLPTSAHIDTSVSIERTVDEALAVIGPRLLGEREEDSRSGRG